MSPLGEFLGIISMVLLFPVVLAIWLLWAVTVLEFFLTTMPRKFKAWRERPKAPERVATDSAIARTLEWFFSPEEKK